MKSIIDQPHTFAKYADTIYREILNLVYDIIFRRLMLYLYKNINIYN